MEKTTCFKPHNRQLLRLASEAGEGHALLWKLRGQEVQSPDWSEAKGRLGANPSDALEIPRGVLGKRPGYSKGQPGTLK